MMGILQRVCICLFCLYALNATAQPDSLWSHTYGGSGEDYCYSIIQTTDGGYALAGATESFSSGWQDFWLVKTDMFGDSLWSRAYGGSGDDWCHEIKQTDDGGFILAGETTSFGSTWHEFWIVKTDANGNMLWNRAYGGSSLSARCYSVQQTTDGGYALGGYYVNAQSQDFWLIKTDADGDSLWSRLYGGDGTDECYAIQQTTDGGYVLAGKTESYGSGRSDFWLLKTNSNGDSLWSRTFGGSGTDECMAVLQTADGGYGLAGYTRSYGSGQDDFWLVRTDADGDSLWSRTYGGSSGEKCFSIQQTVDNGFLLAGSASPYDYLLVKVDANGDSLWSRTYGGSAWDICLSMVVAADAGIALGGYTMSYGAGASDYWLVKISPDPALPAPPQAFQRMTPADSSFTDWPVNFFTWTRSIDPNGDEVTYLLRIESNMPGYELFDVSTPDTNIGFWREPMSNTLDEVYEFHWTVRAAANGDTVAASNGTGIYFYGTPEPPQLFSRITPADSSTLVWTVEQPVVDFNWTRSIDPNGDDVFYIFHIESPTFAGIEPSDAILTDTTISVEIALPVEPLDDIHNFYWTVSAAANGDTVEASNGEGYFTMDIPGAADAGIAFPSEYSLSVYPNPFNPSTTISFDLPQQSFVSLTVYDLLGRELETLLHESIAAGSHSINWHCASCATGLYLLELQAGNHTSITKAILLR